MAEKEINSKALSNRELEQYRLADAAYEDFNR